jgi:hypothetical protein
LSIVKHQKKWNPEVSTDVELRFLFDGFCFMGITFHVVYRVTPTRLIIAQPEEAKLDLGGIKQGARFFATFSRPLAEGFKLSKL